MSNNTLIGSIVGCAAIGAVGGMVSACRDLAAQSKGNWPHPAANRHHNLFSRSAR